MKCTVCGDEKCDVYSTNAFIAPLCSEHQTGIEGAAVALITSKCKTCACIARCCRTKVKK
jgi:hypothetical protein